MRVALSGLGIALAAGLPYLALYGFTLPKIDTTSIIGMLIAALSLAIGNYFIILGMQGGFKLATFTPAYAITSALIVYLIGIFIFRESVMWQHSLGLILGVLSIYFLSIK